jgi:phosphoglycerate dehydrogenase-like enzyme
VAEVLAPLKTRIVATDLYPFDQPRHVESLWPADRLGELLAVSDVVILCVPLTDLTRGLMGAENLARMKQGSMLINVARGPVVVEEDLVAALQSGHLAGAGLDVAAEEPLPADSRLWEQPQVILTPHVAGQGAGRIDRTTELICRNLRHYLRDEPLENLVDKRLGFAPRRSLLKK